MARFRRIVEDYEVRLASPDPSRGGGQAKGKAEHERFEDGEIQFEVRGRGLELADGSELEVRLNGEVVTRVAVSGGRASLRWSSRAGDRIPTVKAGDRLELARGEVVLLAGSFQPD